MNAGLPGTGIGGLFYIASALFMPVHRALRGQGRGGREWQRVCAQGMIAAGILWALAATGWMLGQVVAPAMAAAMPGIGGAAAQQAQNMFRWVAVIGTAGLLAAVLLSVEIARLVVRRRPRRVAVRATLRIVDAIELKDVA